MNEHVLPIVYGSLTIVVTWAQDLDLDGACLDRSDSSFTGFVVGGCIVKFDSLDDAIEGMYHLLRK